MIDFNLNGYECPNCGEQTVSENEHCRMCGYNWDEDLLNNNKTIDKCQL